MTALADLKAHLEIADGDVDDAVLSRFIGAAEAGLGNDVGTDHVPYESLSEPLKMAVLLKAAHFYANREATLVGMNAVELPLGYADLIAPYVRWVF